MARVARCAGALFGWGPNRALSGSGLTTAPVLVSVRSPPFAFLLAHRSGGEQRRGSAKIVRSGEAAVFHHKFVSGRRFRKGAAPTC